jgi:hypothetical protein
MGREGRSGVPALALPRQTILVRQHRAALRRLPSSIESYRSRLFLQRIRGAIAMAVACHARLGDHIDVRIGAAILRIAVADLEYLGRAARLIDEVVAIGVAASEGGAISGPQHLLAAVGDQRQLALEHPHQFVLMAVPVTLARPGAGLDDGQIHAELSQARIAREPLRGLVEARPVEGRRIVALGLNGYRGEKDLFCHTPQSLRHRSVRRREPAAVQRVLAARRAIVNTAKTGYEYHPVWSLVLTPSNPFSVGSGRSGFLPSPSYGESKAVTSTRLPAFGRCHFLWQSANSLAGHLCATAPSRSAASASTPDPVNSTTFPLQAQPKDFVVAAAVALLVLGRERDLEHRSAWQHVYLAQSFPAAR